MPSALIPLANITLGSAAATVTFSSIGQGYRDLLLVITGTAANGQNFWLRFNGDSGANYAYVAAIGTGSATYSFSNSSNTRVQGSVYGGINTTVCSVLYNIMDYSATDKHKTVLSRSNEAATNGTEMVANKWFSNSAITSVTVLLSNSVSYDAGSTFSLYGVSA